LRPSAICAEFGAACGDADAAPLVMTAYAVPMMTSTLAMTT
jgi:hypothetical protein